MSDRIHCPECGEETEFIQLGGAESSTTMTDPEEVGTGLLELRSCMDCPVQIENILTLDRREFEHVERDTTHE